MWKTGLFTGIALLVGAAVVRWQAAGRFCEEPAYEVEGALGANAEIRRYAPRVLAVTRVSASDRERAVSEGFRRLAGYIFGGNVSAASIAMTVPVTQAGAQAGERIAMTAPVTQASASEGGFEVTFTMPASYTLETLPRPSDARVELRALPAERVAVLRYTGSTSGAIVAQHAETLRARVRERGLVPLGEPVSARYDPPSTLPWIRRNEVWLHLEGS